jgi:diacylglycerol kinase (ATP)
MAGCVILNTNAGSARDLETLRQAIGRLGDVALVETTQRGHAIELAKHAIEGGCDLVIAAGGDGTINEVINGLSNDWGQARLGVLPLGTGNDLARTLTIPEEIEAAVEVIVHNRVRSVDIVCVESDATRYFINVSAGGFSGAVDEKLTDEMKASWGPLAYLRAAAMALPDLTPFHTTLQLDDAEPEELIAYNLVVANARYVAGGIPIAPEALLDDGKVDVIIVPEAPMPRLTMLVPQILLGRHLDNTDVIFRRASRVRVDSTPGMWFNSDGELVGNEPATFTVLPRTLRVIVGPEFDAYVKE